MVIDHPLVLLRYGTGTAGQLWLTCPNSCLLSYTVLLLNRWLRSGGWSYWWFSSVPLNASVNLIS